MKSDLELTQGYYYKNEELSSIVEFRIKDIKMDNDQVELEFIKQKIIRDTNEVLDLSDSEIELFNKNKK